MSLEDALALADEVSPDAARAHAALLCLRQARGSASLDADEAIYVIDRLAHLLAEIAVIVNGPEPAGTRWSYHDLPAKVRALATHHPVGLEPRWVEDCQGKASYDGVLLAVSARTWPGNYRADDKPSGRVDVTKLGSVVQTIDVVDDTDAQVRKKIEGIAAFLAASAVGQEPAGMALIPEEPTPEIMAAAAAAIWPTASPADIALAREAANIMLRGAFDAGPGETMETIAASIATMAPAYRAMIAAARGRALVPPQAPAAAVPADVQRAADRYGYLKSHYNPTLMWLLAERREPEEWDAEIDAARLAAAPASGAPR